jgi:DNA repair protein RAD5
MDAPPDFFAVDDDEQPDEPLSDAVHSEYDPDPVPSSSPSSPAIPGSPLFIPEDDSDINNSPMTCHRSLSNESAPLFDDTDMFETVDTSAQKRRSPEASLPRSTVSSETARPTKRRRFSSSRATPFPLPKFESAYFGSIVVSNAWSTVKGKGYIKNGDEIFVEWDGKREDTKASATSKRTHKTDKGKGKQLSITTMLKPQTKRPKRKQNDIVRLTNRSGFGNVASLEHHKKLIRLDRIRSIATECCIVDRTLTRNRYVLVVLSFLLLKYVNRNH